MSQIITLKIDVTKFDESAFYKGQKGTYATVTVFLNNEKDQYGNQGMVTQDIGKERREGGEKGPILGNVTRVNQQQARQQRQPEPQRRTQNQPPANTDLDGDEIPF